MFSEIDRHFCKVEADLVELKSAQTGFDLREAWENYLYNYTRTISRMISLGLVQRKSKPWAYRLKNQWQEGDEGLVFLREARNVAEHALSPCAEFHDPHVNVSGIAALGSGSSISFENCKVNGHEVEFAKVSNIEGKAVQLGKLPIQVEEVAAQIVLVKIISEEKKREFEVPLTLGNRVLPKGNPIYLADEAMQFLKTKKEELEELTT